jgi:hypothetical protein
MTTLLFAHSEFGRYDNASHTLVLGSPNLIDFIVSLSDR